MHVYTSPSDKTQVESYVSEQLDNAATIHTTTDGNKSHSLVHSCVASMVNTQKYKMQSIRWVR